MGIIKVITNSNDFPRDEDIGSTLESCIVNGLISDFGIIINSDRIMLTILEKTENFEKSFYIKFLFSYFNHMFFIQNYNDIFLDYDGNFVGSDNNYVALYENTLYYKSVNGASMANINDFGNIDLFYLILFYLLDSMGVSGIEDILNRNILGRGLRVRNSDNKVIILLPNGQLDDILVRDVYYKSKAIISRLPDRNFSITLS